MTEILLWVGILLFFAIAGTVIGYGLKKTNHKLPRAKRSMSC